MMQHNWIFQMASAPAGQVRTEILRELNAFVANWKSHGSPVPGQVEIRHGQFIVVVAEPGHASGCSIDAMNKGVNEILKRYEIAVLGPENIFYLAKNGTLAHIDFKEVKAAILDGRIDADSSVFDSTMGQTNDLARWEVPLHMTWMTRFIPQKV